MRSADGGPRGLTLTVDEALASAHERNEALRALLGTQQERERIAAEARAKAVQGPLSGVPFVLKDVWDVAGLATTAGCAAFSDRIATSSGAVHRTFSDAGAVLVGKSNLSELALTPECASTVGGRTVHPFDPNRSPGGSSGGGAAAVAAGLATFDWGSDFGGSIRLPAAFCGLVGLRLSARIWAPQGHFPEGVPAAELNGMGPIAASVEDCLRLVEVAAPTLRGVPAPEWTVRSVAVLSPDAHTVGAWPAFEGDVSPLLQRMGLPRAEPRLPAPREIEQLFTRHLARHWPDWSMGLGPFPAMRTLRSLLAPGPTSLHPDTARVAAELTLLSLREAPFHREIDRQTAQLRSAMQRLWFGGTALLTPTTPWPAPRHGLVRRLPGLTAFVKLGNLVDATALTVPFGTFPDGFPRGLQLLGPPGAEKALLDLARRMHRAVPT